MLRIVFFLGCLCASLHGFAYQDTALQTASREYQAQLSALTFPANFSKAKALRRGLNYQKQTLWPEAIEQFQTLIAAGEQNTLVWLALSDAWQQLSGNTANRQRALQAAYRAYELAASEAEQADALFQLGALYLVLEQPQAAIAAWQEGLGLAENRDIARQFKRLKDSQTFQVRGVEVESDAQKPRICLLFSAALASENPPQWGDYVQLQPAIPLEPSANGNRLCLAGVSHGSDYQITVKAGIPSARGLQTQAIETFSARVDDRSPTVGFRGNRYILPRTGSQSLPLTTINVKQVALALYRINDRNLIHQINQDRLQAVLSGRQTRRIANQTGEQVWQGELSVNHSLNEEITTAIPMRQVLPDPEPGIYILTARDAEQEPDQWQDLATQWLVISDLGISSLKGRDGLHIFVRSLASAEPLAQVQLKLLARNNTVLAEAVSDEQGYVRFASGLLRGSGGLQPVLVQAYDAAADYNFLDLSRPAFDLSDRGVGGRPAPGPLDAFVYSERGVYRPGEQVELMVLLRDDRGFALSQDLPLTLSVVRPDQIEAERLTLTPQSLQGAYYTRLNIPNNAYTGTWQARVYADPEQVPIGQLSFLVEDFVPQQLTLELSSGQSILSVGQSTEVVLQGDYLYGAPAANLNTAAELIVRPDPEPFPEYAEYQFGRVEEQFESQRFSLEAPKTDNSGQALITVGLDKPINSSKPLQVRLRASLFEPGGRPVHQVLDFAYRNQAVAVGINKAFADNLALGQPAAFKLVTLDAQGQLQPSTVAVELVQEHYEYYWYFEDNRWNYRLIIRDSAPLASQQLDITTAPASLRYDNLDWGSYRLDVRDVNSTASSSLRFNVGWYAAPSADDAPDKLRITLDKPSYQHGETAMAHIQAPFAGTVLLNIASERLWQTLQLDLPAEGLDVELPVTADWSPGVYLTASAFRPADSTQGATRGPNRAVGVTWLGLDRDPRTLKVTVDAPTELRPRQRVEIPVNVTGMEPGQSAFITLAAVDEGILQLTNFASPDPLDYFLGKRRLGAELFDLYGKLIAAGGQEGALRNGAGAEAEASDGSDVQPIRTVALFSGPVQVPGDGQVRILFDLPDFNGQLRLMAVAWDQDRFGQAEQPLLVRDPLVTKLYLPRFLAPDDQATMTFTVDNLEAPAGEYRLRLSASGAVALADAKPIILRFSEGVASSQQTFHYTVQGSQAGVGQLLLEATGPEGFQLLRDWSIRVRAPQTRTTERQTRQLLPDETLTLNSAMLQGLLQPEVQLSLASQPPLNVAGLFAQLDYYPYGCVEQITSRALPLIYLTETGEYYGIEAPAEPIRNRVQKAIQRVLALQKYSGGFGLWHQYSPTEMWLSAYVMEFLVRAKARQYLVPESPYRRGLEWLHDRLAELNYDRLDDLANRAYLLYVLALAQQAPLGEMRYLHDNYLDRIPSRLARAQLAAALAYYGDRQRAQAAFTAAQQATNPELQRLFDYGSELRDQAAIIALQAASGTPVSDLTTAASQLAAHFQERTYTSTQEQAWLLLAAHALAADTAPVDTLNLQVAGQPIQSLPPFTLQPDINQLYAGLTVHNTSANPYWYVLSRSGVPERPLPPAEQGIRIKKTFYSGDGQVLQGNEILQNEAVIVVIEGQIDTEVAHQLLVVDLLPAGLELENARLGEGATLEAYAWLDGLSRTKHEERLDDRFVAALDTDSNQRTFKLAYLARAVTPGNFIQPAVFAEDMYKPWFFGRGEMARISVQ